MSAMREVQIIVNDEPPTRGEFSFHVEQIDVSTLLPRPDPHWKFVDANGHFHAYTTDLKLPTLVRRLERVEYEEPDEDGETGYTIEHWHCAICDDEIHPGTMMKTWRESAPGRMSWTVRVNAPGAIGEKKSVRVIRGDQMHFGIGVVDNIRDDHGHPAIEIYGIGKLGSRQA